MASPPIDFPVSYVDVVVGYETQNGVEEVIHRVHSQDRCDILSVTHGVKRKTKAMTDTDGSIIRYEPTGEETLTLRVDYIRG